MAAKARQTSTVTPAMIRFLRPVFSIAASYSIPCKVLRTAYALRNGRNQRGVGGASKGGQGPVPPLNCRSRRDGAGPTGPSREQSGESDQLCARAVDGTDAFSRRSAPSPR